MRKAAVRHGDPTTTRGFVIAVTSSIFDDGKKVALSGDEATCGNCKGAYKIFGTGKGISEKGRDVVVDGDLVLCPCKKNRVIVGSHPGIFLNTNRGSTVANSPGAATTPASKPIYDEQFRLVDEYDSPHANCHYVIQSESGRLWFGYTDSDGLTERVCTNQPEHLSITIHREDNNA
jgi:hypothetical protein